MLGAEQELETMLTLVLATALTWAVWFTLMLIPAYWICQRWLPVPQLKPSPVAYVGLVLIFGVYSQLVVMVVAIAVMLGEALIVEPWQSRMIDLQRFVIPLATVLLFPPTFTALVSGYRNVRRKAFGSDGSLVAT